MPLTQTPLSKVTSLRYHVTGTADAELHPSSKINAISFFMKSDPECITHLNLPVSALRTPQARAAINATQDSSHAKSEQCFRTIYNAYVKRESTSRFSGSSTRRVLASDQTARIQIIRRVSTFHCSQHIARQGKSVHCKEQYEHPGPQQLCDYVRSDP